MSNRTLAFAVAVLAALLVVAVVTRTPERHIILSHEATVADTTLPAGDYQLLVDNHVATFLRNGRPVAVITVRGVDAGRKFETTRTLVGSDGHSLQEIELAGTSTRWVLNDSNASSAPSEDVE